MRASTDRPDPPASAATDFDRFDAQARSWLSEHAEDIRRELIHSGLPGDPEWHPNGFAVAELGRPTPFPTVRIHVWSSALRVCFPAHPTVHSHDRHITSIVLAGRYEDLLYRVRPAGATEAHTHQRYRVRKRMTRGIDGDGDTLVPVDEYVNVSALERRMVQPDDVHGIPAGVAHETLMRPSEFCLTLAAKDVPVGRDYEFVVDRPGVPERLIARRQLTRDERNDIHREIAERLARAAEYRA